MKKMTYKLIALLGISGMAIFASSCLKDSHYTDFAGVSNIVEFLDATPTIAISLNADSTKTTDDIYYIRVNQAGANATTSDITYTIAVDPTQIDVYNSDPDHVTAVQLPDNAYTLTTTGTIKAGTDALGNANRTDSVILAVHPSKVPHVLGVNYLLPIKIITSSAGTTPSANYGVILYNFYHNIYDGNYSATVTRYNFNQTSDYAGWDLAADAPKAGSVIASTQNGSADSPAKPNPLTPWPLKTVNSVTSSMYAGNLQGGFGTMDIVVDPATNIVTTKSVAATALTNLIDLPGVTSTYDPVTKKWKIYYQYTNVDATTGNPTSFRVLKVFLTKI